MKNVKFYLIIFVLVIISLFASGCEKEVDHFDEWVQKGKNYYYYDNSGNKIKDTIRRIGNYQYCFDKDGKLCTGFQVRDGKMYYFDDKGKMQRGWISIEGDYYYLNKQTGEAVTDDWQEDEDGWYYLDLNGKMLTNQWKGDYYVGADGKMYVNGMYNIDGKDCYFDGNGKYVKDYAANTMILSWINGMIAMYDSTRREQELKYVEIHSADPNNIKFSYIFGTNESGFNRMKGTGSVFIDYVVGAVINGNFMRNPNPIYDNVDYTNINNLKNSWKSLSSDASKYNLKTTSDEYKNGKRDDCKKGLWLTANPTYIKTNLSDSDLGAMRNYISRDFPLTTVVMTESCMDEVIELSNMLKKYR